MSGSNRLPEAEPQTRGQVQETPRCPAIVDAAAERGIESIVHFTTIRGLLGILHRNAVCNRRDLPADGKVQFVYEPNAIDRHLDERWHSYVNLSVTDINLHMFDFSNRRRPGEEWIILGFGPEILGDRGVVFCTTNNIYPAALRATGLAGFEQMFAPAVAGRYGRLTERCRKSARYTTDPQAEVLYPYELPLTYMHTITALNDDVYEAAVAALAHFPHEPIVVIDPEAFR